MPAAGGDRTDPAERPEDALRLRALREGDADRAVRGVLDLDRADWEGEGERWDWDGDRDGEAERGETGADLDALRETWLGLGDASPGDLVFLAKFEIFAGERDSTAPDLGDASGLALALALSAVWPLATFLGAALGGFSSSESLSFKAQRSTVPVVSGRVVLQSDQEDTSNHTVIQHPPMADCKATPGLQEGIEI